MPKPSPFGFRQFTPPADWDCSGENLQEMKMTAIEFLRQSIPNSFTQEQEEDLAHVMESYAKEKSKEIRHAAAEIAVSGYTIENVISYIENDAEIAIPMDRLFNENGEHVTKKEYGLVLLEILCAELREHFGGERDANQAHRDIMNLQI